MKIAFNPSTVAALITPPNNKDITFDLRGRNIFARGVKFCGTDTWRDIKINNVSIGSNILDLRNGSNTTLTNTNGVVTINSTWRPVVDNLTSDSTTSSLSANQGRVLKSLIDGKSNSGHTHDDRYLKLTGGTMTGNIILSRSTAIIKPLASTSNYDSVVRWSVDGETKKHGREIGLHNLGGSDSTGSIAIVPYKTDTEPWSGNVGLFIAKNTLKLDGKPIALKNDIPTSLKNPYSLTLQANGTTLATYDGSVSKIVNLTYDNVGAAAKNHTHNSLEPWASYSYITGDSHATALKSIFDKNKTSIPRNKFISMLSRAYDNTSYYMGYFIKNYDNNPYGGFFVAHYDTAYYIGIANGSFTQHRLVYSTDIPNSLKNPHALTISLNGTSQGPYDGSAAKNINITPSSIGAATSGHNHDNRYLKLTGGTMQLGEGLKFHADENYFGTDLDARIISLLDGNDKVCDGGLIIDERATLDGKEYVTELLRIRDSEFKWRGADILHSGNYSGILDSRYYTESEVNNLLFKKLNISDFNWTNLKDKPNTVQGYGISNALIVSYDGNNYVNASMPSSQLSKLAGQYYIECWDGEGGWWNWMAGKFMKAGSSDAYVLLGGGGHKAESSLRVEYASSAGNADTIDNIHSTGFLRWKGMQNIGNNAPFQAVVDIIKDTSKLNDGGLSFYSYLGDEYTVLIGSRNDASRHGNALKWGYANKYLWMIRMINGSPKSSDWEKISAGYADSAGSVAWANVTGKPSSYIPSAHTHSWTSITDKIVGGNEFNIVNAGFNDQLYFNYLPIDNRNSSAAISQYVMGNGNRSLASVYAKRFKVDGQGCMWKEARDYAPFYSTYNGGFEPILDIKTVSGDWSIGSYDNTGNYLIFAYESDSDYNAGVNGTAQYWLSPGGEFKINTLRLAGPTSTNMGVSSTNPQIIFSKSDYIQQVALTYTELDAYRPSKGLKVHSYDGSDDSNVWFEVQGYNYSSGYVKNGSSDAYVLLGGGGHKPLSDFASSSHSHNYAANENYGGFTKSGRLPISGFYQSCESESGGNAPWSNWVHLINCQHNNTDNNYALQIAASFFNNNTFKIRVTENNVNNAWRDIIHSGNIGDQTVANAYHLRINSANTWSTWYWVGQSGQPSWLWGSNDGTNMYVWNPSNFRVAYASSAGNADTVDGYHVDDILPYGLENLCIGAVASGGQTILNSDGSITTSGNNSDTYFFVRSTENLIAGQIYTVGFYVTGVPSGNTATWSFPFAGQGNNKLVINIKSNGWCCGTGTIPEDIVAGKNIIFDDSVRGFYSSINISKFVIVKGKQKAYYTPPISKMSVNYANSAGSATKVIVNQHTTNDVNYPLVWSNQNNSNNVTENQLYKSWSDLYYNPKNKRLTVGGSIYAAHFYESSDKTLKKNIKSILSSTNIPKIREFDWKDTEEHSYGFIAQELEEQGYGCLVNEANGKKTVNYTATLALTVAKLQNLINIQNKKISNLTKELKALKYGRKKNS